MKRFGIIKLNEEQVSKVQEVMGDVADAVFWCAIYRQGITEKACRQLAVDFGEQWPDQMLFKTQLRCYGRDIKFINETTLEYKAHKPDPEDGDAFSFVSETHTLDIDKPDNISGVQAWLMPADPSDDSNKTVYLVYRRAKGY